MSDRPTPEFDPNGSWQRWQMGELATPRPRAEQSAQPSRQQQRAAAARRAAEQAQKREAEKRQAEYEAARKEAEEEGYRAGYERGLEEGQAQGLEEGRQQAREELEARVAETVSPLAPLARRFSEALEQLDEEVAQDMVELALSTGRYLAGDAFDASPAHMLEIVRELLHTEPPLVGQQRLWLNPDDHTLVERHMGDELAAAGWKLQPDSQLARGGCRVTSEQGEVDATFESRWQAIKMHKRKRQPSSHDA